MKHIVVGILINSTGKILIAQRLAHQEAPGIWEFPGGKVEEGEDAFSALRREFQEEIGIEILNAEVWLDVEYEYPHKKVWLNTWMIKSFEGEPRGAEGQEIRWVSVAELSEYEFPAGNKEIIEKLNFAYAK